MEQNGAGPQHIIVIGTSAGGLTALNELVAHFKPEWNAAYFIVMHLSRNVLSDFLVTRLKQHTTLPCSLGIDGLLIEKGHVYIGAPNFHLIVKKGQTKQGHGPEENRFRPSIDVLFRSAAASYDSHVTGIVLTGFLDDGTAGMWAIKRTGGTTIVQDPNEAEYPDMPMSVLNKMDVDYCISIKEMGEVLDTIISEKQFTEQTIPAELATEAAIAEKMATGINQTAELGEQTVFTCPDCGGILFEINDGKLNHYRCYTGHVYSENSLELTQSNNVESTLWVALRMMEERKNLLDKMGKNASGKGHTYSAKSNKEKSIELDTHIHQLKTILFDTQNNDEA